MYGNWKNRMGFLRLNYNPVRYSGDAVNCSVCGKSMTYEQTNQLWISLKVGTDILPLLTNLCSKECEHKLPSPPEDYIQFAHKGGADLNQPLDEDERFDLEMEHYEANQNNGVTENETAETTEIQLESQSEKKEAQLLKLIRKIWDR